MLDTEIIAVIAVLVLCCVALLASEYLGIARVPVNGLVDGLWKAAQRVRELQDARAKKTATAAVV